MGEWGPRSGRYLNGGGEGGGGGAGRGRGSMESTRMVPRECLSLPSSFILPHIFHAQSPAPALPLAVVKAEQQRWARQLLHGNRIESRGSGQCILAGMMGSFSSS